MTLEERAAINAKIERLWNTSTAVADGAQPTKADWTKFARERTRLFNKLGRGCRYCGNPAPGFFMLQGDLWPKVIGVEPGRRCYGAGWVCLACCAERIFPRQLYDTDFGVDGRDEEQRLFQEVVEEDPAGYSYTAHSTLTFPREGGAPEVRVETWFSVHLPPNAQKFSDILPMEEWSDAIWDRLIGQEFEHIGWLEDYCSAHGLRLIRDGEEVDQRDSSGTRGELSYAPGDQRTSRPSQPARTSQPVSTLPALRRRAPSGQPCYNTGLGQTTNVTTPRSQRRSRGQEWTNDNAKVERP